MKVYRVYKFPSSFGTPKEFNFLFIAWLHAKMQVGYVCELENIKTKEYKAYWA